MVNKLFQMFIYQFSALVFVMTKKIGSNFSYIFSNLLKHFQLLVGWSLIKLVTITKVQHYLDRVEQKRIF